MSQIKDDRLKVLETCLVLATGFLLLFLVTGKAWLIYVAFGVGITGIFFKALAGWLTVLWFKIGELLGFVVPKLVLGLIFFVVLLPVSLLYRMFNKDKLRIRRSAATNWVERNKTYTSADFENVW